jgi:hypothetical protein
MQTIESVFLSGYAVNTMPHPDYSRFQLALPRNAEGIYPLVSCVMPGRHGQAITDHMKRGHHVFLVGNIHLTDDGPDVWCQQVSISSPLTWSPSITFPC